MILFIIYLLFIYYYYLLLFIYLFISRATGRAICDSLDLSNSRATGRAICDSYLAKVYYSQKPL